MAVIIRSDRKTIGHHLACSAETAATGKQARFAARNGASDQICKAT